MVHLAIDKCGDELDEEECIPDLPHGYEIVSEVSNPFRIVEHCSVSLPQHDKIKEVKPKKTKLTVREIIQAGVLRASFEISPKYIEPCVTYRLRVNVTSKTGTNEMYFNWEASKPKFYSGELWLHDR